MKTEKYLRLGWLLYASIATFLFIYMVPFFLIGFAPVQPEGSIQIAQNSILELTDGQRLAPPTRAAVWFAECRSFRLWITVIIIVLMVVIEFSLSKPYLREQIYQVIIWISLAVFGLNFVGTMCILVVN